MLRKGRKFGSMVAVAAVPTAEEVADGDAVISKDGRGEAMAKALVATTARKAAGQAANNLSYKSPPQRPDLIAEFLSGMRARQERDDGIFSRVRENGDEEEIARATRALSRLRDEIDA